MRTVHSFRFSKNISLISNLLHCLVQLLNEFLHNLLIDRVLTKYVLGFSQGASLRNRIEKNFSNYQTVIIPETSSVTLSLKCVKLANVNVNYESLWDQICQEVHRIVLNALIASQKVKCLIERRLPRCIATHIEETCIPNRHWHIKPGFPQLTSTGCVLKKLRRCLVSSDNGWRV